MLNIPLVFAFIAGLISFLSPCVLPLIPGYLAYLAGSSTAEEKPKQIDLFMSSVFSVLGFALVFAIMGILLNTVLKETAYSVQMWLSRLGGVIIIIFGLFLTGLLQIPFLERKYRLRLKFNSKLLTSFVFGASFAVGWSPCVGAALGSILGLAATHPLMSFSLLFTYSIGFGIPFLIVGAFTAQASALITKYYKWLLYLKVLFGVFLIFVGILIFTQSLNLIANFQILNDIILRR